MKRNKLTILAPAPILAAIGVVVATFGVSDQASRLAVVMLATGGTLVTVILSRMQRDAEVGRFLRDVMLLGIGVRLLVFALVHQSVGPYVFAPDQFTYEGWGDGLVAFFFNGAPFPRRLADSIQIGYPLINAGVFAVFGPARSAPAILNVFLSVWTAIPVYYLALMLVRSNEGVARWATWLTVMFPSLILWSVLNIREAPTILTIVLTIYFLVRVQRHADLAGAAGVVVGLAVLTVFREYLTALVGLSGAAGILMGRSRSPIRSLIVGSAMMIAVAFAFQTLGLGGSLSGEPTLERAQLLRQDFQFGAGSAYGEAADVSTTGGALLYLPLGLAYFLLAPFPWAVSSTLQAITLPEIIIWWSVFPFGIWGMILAIRHDARAYTVPVAVLVLVTFAYALVESNVGTAYRHRAQVLPIAFIFCALGLRDAYALWAQRRREGERRVGRASHQGALPREGAVGRRP